MQFCGLSPDITCQSKKWSLNFRLQDSIHMAQVEIWKSLPQKIMTCSDIDFCDMQTKQPYPTQRIFLPACPSLKGKVTRHRHVADVRTLWNVRRKAWGWSRACCNVATCRWRKNDYNQSPYFIICITPAEVERVFGCFWHETTDSKKEYEGHYHEKAMVEKTLHLYVGY